MFFGAWLGLGAPFKGYEKGLWISLMYLHGALVYNWGIRNRVIFENFKPDWDLETQRMKTRLGYWEKAWCQSFPFLFALAMHDVLIN